MANSPSAACSAARSACCRRCAARGPGVGPVAPARPRSNLAWAGLLVGGPALLEALPAQRPCDLGHDVLPRLLGRMRGVAIRGFHADVGTPEAWREACADLERLESAA